MKKKDYAAHNLKQCQTSYQWLASEPMKHTNCACSIFPRGSMVLRAMCGDSDDEPSKLSSPDSKDEKNNKGKKHNGKQDTAPMRQPIAPDDSSDSLDSSDTDSSESDFMNEEPSSVLTDD